MSELILWMVTVFGGVFGALIGFLIIGATGALLALPYVMMTRRSEHPRARQDAIDGRYSAI